MTDSNTPNLDDPDDRLRIATTHLSGFSQANKKLAGLIPAIVLLGVGGAMASAYLLARVAPEDVPAIKQKHQEATDAALVKAQELGVSISSDQFGKILEGFAKAKAAAEENIKIEVLQKASEAGVTISGEQLSGILQSYFDTLANAAERTKGGLGR